MQSYLADLRILDRMQALVNALFKVLFAEHGHRAKWDDGKVN